MTDCNLYRPVNPKSIKPELVVIIGNGAIKNGTMPLLHHFNSKRMYYTPREAIAALGECTFLYKVARNNLLGEIIKNADPSKISAYKDTIDKFFIFTNELAQQFKAHHYGLEFNSEIEIIKKRTGGKESGVISTNWDECAWEKTSGNECLFPNIIQIHGRCSDHASLILPTELTTDDEIKRITGLIQDKKMGDEAYNAIVNRLDTYGCKNCINRRDQNSGE